jgi:hypothetical protein
MSHKGDSIVYLISIWLIDMRYTKLMLQSLMIVTVVLSTFIFVSYAQQEQQESAIVGEIVKLETFRGRATLREEESSEILNASIVLTGEITEINRTRIIIKIIDGDIKIGENSYLVESGSVRAIFRKFGWIAVTGNAASYDGSTFRFHLEGMLHIEHPRLVISGLAGTFLNEKSDYVLRLMTRIQRIE